MNSDGVLLSIHSKQPKLDKCAQFFKHFSHPRGAVTITSLSQSKDVHHSCDIVLHHSLSVTRRPWWWRTSSLRHWRDPPGDCHPVARRLQRMDGERATVRPSVLRAASSQLLAYSKRSPAQLKKCFISQIKLKKDSQQTCCCLSVILLAPTYLQPIASLEQFQFNDNFCFKS